MGRIHGPLESSVHARCQLVQYIRLEILSGLSPARGPARLACTPSECGWCRASPLVACVAPIQRSCVPKGCDRCQLHRFGVPARLACPPSCSYSVVQWTCSPGLPLVCLTRLSYCRVTQIVSSVAGGASVRPTWAPSGCDWCLWHLLLSYGMPVQLGSVPSRCCGCWLCLGGSVVSAGPLPSDQVVCLMSPVTGGASVRPTWAPPGCDGCLWHLLLSYGVPVQLGSVPSRCCGCWLCLGGSVVSAGPLPSDPVVCLMSPVTDGASVRLTWAPPGCDGCLWHLLLSYGVPVQLGSVPSRCCGCWLCLGGSVVSAGPLPSDPVVCLMSPVASGASVRPTWAPPGCDWCLWHLLLSYGMPVQLGSVPSRCCGC